MTYKTAYWDSVTKTQQERDCTPDEVAEIDTRKAEAEAAAPNQSILAQIAALEATATPRRLREAVTTTQGKAWLAALDAQIAALRAQIT